MIVKTPGTLEQPLAQSWQSFLQQQQQEGEGDAAPVVVSGDNTPPPADPPPAPEQTPAEKELADFKAPSLDFLEEDPKKEEEKPGVKPPAKADEPKPGDKKTEVKPAAKAPEPITDNTPAKLIRERLTQVEKERDEYKAKAENPVAVSELQNKYNELEKEHKRVTEERASFEKKLIALDPRARGEIDKLTSDFDTAVGNDFKSVPALRARYPDLLGEYVAAINSKPAEAEAAMAKFKSTLRGLKRKEGENEVPIFDAEDMPSVMAALRRGAEFIEQRDTLSKKLDTDGAKMQFEGAEREWKDQDKKVSEEIGRALEVPDDIETADPFNPISWLSKALEEVPEANRKTLVGKVDTFVRRLFSGAKPRSDAEFPGLEPAQIRERIAAEAKWHEQARPLAIKSMKQGLLAMALLRPFLAEWSKVNARDERRSKNDPPDPSTGKSGSGGASQSLEDFKAPTEELAAI